jgi:hypothetical protein
MTKDSSPHEIALEGKLYIDKATETYKRLKEAFEKYSDVTINWDKAEDIDLPVLQLLYAVKREVSGKGKGIHFSGNVQDRVSSRLYTCGFMKGLPVSGEELEAGLADF